MNYKESAVSGTSYVRAKEVVLRNELTGVKGAAFIEEQVVSIAGTKVIQPFAGIFKEFTPENAGTPFALLDADGNPTGQTATFGDVYQLVSSLYYHVANERDAAASSSNG